MPNGHTQILTVHFTRLMARLEENRIQEELTAGNIPVDKNGNLLPDWVKGVRVRKAGLFQYVVEATEWRGH